MDKSPMGKAIYFVLQAILAELMSQRIALGEAERSALQAESEAARDAAVLTYKIWNIRQQYTNDGPPQSERDARA